MAIFQTSAKVSGSSPIYVGRKKCIECGKCQKVCPMQLSVKEILKMLDCIKCVRFVEACPKDALSF
ncbi:MAG: 4Fe-4S dicluster domain-containing protein [Methanothrix sp.]|nr:4Fe-4S dicluster domain-containing protein [Methanothrix sp.]